MAVKPRRQTVVVDVGGVKVGGNHPIVIQSMTNTDTGRKTGDNFRTMIEVAMENNKPVRIGVNWGSLDSALLTRMMDRNAALPEPKDAREVTLDAMVASAIESAQAAERYGLTHD